MSSVYQTYSNIFSDEQGVLFCKIEHILNVLLTNQIAWSDLLVADICHPSTPKVVKINVRLTVETLGPFLYGLLNQSQSEMYRRFPVVYLNSTAIVILADIGNCHFSKDTSHSLTFSRLTGVVCLSR